MNYRKKHKHITTKIKSTLSQKSKLHFDNKEILTIFAETNVSKEMPYLPRIADTTLCGVLKNIDGSEGLRL